MTNTIITMKKIAILIAFLSIQLMQAQDIIALAVSAPQDEQQGYLPEGWLHVYKNEYSGYINGEGKEVVPAIYDHVGEFGIYKDNWALVSVGDLMGFIDTDGNVVAEPQYDGIGKFNEYREGWLQVFKNGYIGFIDENGREVVKPVYTDIALPKHD